MQVTAKPFVINCADIPQRNPSALTGVNKLTLLHGAGLINMDNRIYLLMKLQKEPGNHS